MITRICHFLMTIALLVLLNSCSSTTPRPAGDLSSEQRAERAYAEGDYPTAAEYWQLAGDTATLDDSNTLRVKTADAWLRSGRINRAAELLAQVDQDRLNDAVRALYYIAQAELAIQQGNPGLAGLYLQAVSQYIPTQLESRYGELRSRLFGLERDPSGRSLAEAAELSVGMASYQPELALEILRSLESVSSGTLERLIAGQQHDPEFIEWLELTLQVRTTMMRGESTGAAARYWANYHYGHLVSRQNFTKLVSSYRSLFPVPSRVAVLLPDTGGLSAAAKAIRDGILSAYLDHPGDAVIRFYSSGENSETAIAAYLQARDEGAMQIIGPLQIESTRALSSQKNPSIPILLLNEPDKDVSDDPRRQAFVNSLSLSQTEEAQTIAARILARGQKRALILVPDNAWGGRIATAFTSAFESGGGQITASARFDSSEIDHSDMLTQMLKIDESRQRKADLQARLGVPLTFEPIRRDDFDLIFMAVSPAQGRALKPLLRFHDAGDVPVYAMGRVFSGRIETTADQDLNGIVFPSTHWQMSETNGSARDEALSLTSVRSGTYGSLYTLGQDAWRLLPWLPLMRKDQDLWYTGGVGSLRLQANGRLYREPVWAQISAGRPVPYQWPDKR